jgi:hypothetical protein
MDLSDFSHSGFDASRADVGVDIEVDVDFVLGDEVNVEVENEVTN